MTPSPLTVALVAVVVLPVAVPVVVARCAWAAVYPEGPREAVGLLRDAVRDIARRARNKRPRI